MDKTTKQLVDFTLDFKMDEAGQKATIDHLFDSIACAIIGSTSEPARITAKVARMLRSDGDATVFGFGVKTSAELAALANTMMIRTFDYNDGMDVRGGAHASDMLSGPLAAAEVVHASGRDTLQAIALSYEILGGLGYDIRLSPLGFDQGTFVNVAVALAVGKLWGLDAGQLANASSLALVPNLPLGASRWGALSMMKGCATAFSTRNGVFAAMMAKEGFTSADEPFEGIRGLHHITGAFPVYLPLSPSGVPAIQMAAMKFWPAEGNVQGLLGLVPKIRAFASVDDIDWIDVTVNNDLVVHLADEPKYDPQTRETADHSLPYMLMIALQDGTITLDSYGEARYLDPALRPVLRKVRVHGSKQYDEMSREQMQRTHGWGPPRPAHIVVHRKDGAVFDEEVLYHKGHPSDPMSHADLDEKLDLCGKGILTLEQRERIRAAWWDVANTNDIRETMATMTGFQSLD